MREGIAKPIFVPQLYGDYRGWDAPSDPADAWRCCEARFIADSYPERRPGSGSTASELEHLGAHVPRLVHDVLALAFERGYSDVHFELRSDLSIRVRQDGLLREFARVPRPLGDLITGRLKVLTRQPLDVGHQPADATLVFADASGRPAYGRVSLVHLVDGEKIVLRLLTRSFAPDLEHLGLSEAAITCYRDMLQKPGLILIAGPAGSGKTTTLYATLASLANGCINIISIENPVEQVLPGVTQVEIDRRRGLTFETALVGAVRQDPDVIAIGEIRDAESAEVAARAALTGRLVLASIHAHDAVGAAYRLVEFGVPAAIVAGAINGAMAQRLVRLTCPECAGLGCGSCEESGYRGRTGLFEVVPFLPKISRALGDGVSLEGMRLIRYGLGHPGLTHAAAELVSRNITSQAESDRVLAGSVIAI